jgi:hypothetical protein
MITKPRFNVIRLNVSLDPETLSNIKIISRRKTKGNEAAAVRLAVREYARTLNQEDVEPVPAGGEEIDWDKCLSG